MAPPPDNNDDDARFLPPPVAAVGLTLDVEAPQPSAPAATTDAPAPAPATERLRCQEHGLLEPCSRCAQSAEPEFEPIPGRLMQGALRKQPLVRVGIGLVLGLVVGWMIAQPYANRAERRVAQVRAEADRNRYWNAEEKRALAVQLDSQADDLSNRAAYGTIAIWLLAGGALVAGWFRAT